MLSQLDKTQALLQLYKEEKSTVVDDLDSEGFPSFKEWRAQIESERQPGDYRTVTVEQADEEMDAVLDEVDNQPATNATKESETMNTQTDGTQASTTETNASEPTTTTPAAPKAKRVRKAAAPKAAKKQSKSELARAIFKRLSRGKTLNREKILEAFQKEAGLSAKGAATYYQSIKGKGGKKAA